MREPDYFDYEQAADEHGVICKRCGKDELFWQQVGDKYRLFEARKHGSIAPHVCPPPDVRNVFDDIP